MLLSRDATNCSSAKRTPMMGLCKPNHRQRLPTSVQTSWPPAVGLLKPTSSAHKESWKHLHSAENAEGPAIIAIGNVTLPRPIAGWKQQSPRSAFLVRFPIFLRECLTRRVRMAKPNLKCMRLHAAQKFNYGHHTPVFGRVKRSREGKWRICDDFSPSAGESNYDYACTRRNARGSSYWRVSQRGIRDKIGIFVTSSPVAVPIPWDNDQEAHREPF